MSSRRHLERDLERLAGFDDPRLDLEQYATSAEVAASIVHEADLRGDLDRPVVDLGAGTGILAVGAARRGASPVVGLEVDPDAIAVARANAGRLEVAIDWVRGRVERHPLAPSTPMTVLTNPPFGAQTDHRGADRAFLAAAADVAAVSYSIHNAGSREFLEAFVADHGGDITHRYRATLTLPRQFAFHRAAEAAVDAEVIRVAWG